MTKYYEKKEYNKVDMFFRKFWRAITNSNELEAWKKNELDILNLTYEKYFDKIPEILNVGDDYNNRQSLSHACFQNSHWRSKIRGNTLIYTDIENMVDIICSYEVEKVDRVFMKYTSDPVHLFFHDFKCYLVCLSSSKFTLEDLKAAEKWQMLLSELVFNKVFEAPDQEKDIDRRKVLFDLELIMRESVIPKLDAFSENKAALYQLDEVCSYFDKFTNTACEYLFYIARDSDYVPNFSMRKLQLMFGEKLSYNTFGLTSKESANLEKIRDTVPLKLLHMVFSKSYERTQRDILALVSQDNIVNDGKSTYLSQFNKDVSTETKNVLSALKMLNKVERSEYLKKHHYAEHINIKHYLVALEILNEINKFKEIFFAVKACAVMGGNLLTFGCLRDELLQDIKDCSQCFCTISDIISRLEKDAWDGYRIEVGGKVKLSEAWKENYTKAAHENYNILKDNCNLVQVTLRKLAAATVKRNTTELLQETKRVIDRYKALHDYHFGMRTTFIDGLHTHSVSSLPEKNMLLKLMSSDAKKFKNLETSYRSLAKKVGDKNYDIVTTSNECDDQIRKLEDYIRDNTLEEQKQKYFELRSKFLKLKSNIKDIEYGKTQTSLAL